jgi:hypothetical protein
MNASPVAWQKRNARSSGASRSRWSRIRLRSAGHSLLMAKGGAIADRSVSLMGRCPYSDQGQLPGACPRFNLSSSSCQTRERRSILVASSIRETSASNRASSIRTMSTNRLSFTESMSGLSRRISAEERIAVRGDLKSLARTDRGSSRLASAGSSPWGACPTSPRSFASP